MKKSVTQLFGILCVFLLCGPLVVNADTQADAMWFVDILKTHNGKEFCAPGTTTVNDALASVMRFSHAHPEFHDQLTTPMAIQGLAEAYPCSNSKVSSALDPSTRIRGTSNVDASASGAPRTVKTISPIFSQLFLAPLPAGFVQIFEKAQPPNYIRESVLVGETAAQWTQMITITGAKDLAARPDLTPQKFAERVASGFKNACPNSFALARISGDPVDGHEAFAGIASCGTSPATGGKQSETALIEVIKGENDYYTMQWAERAAPSDVPMTLDIPKWLERSKQLAQVKLCPIVPGEAAPYPSCLEQKPSQPGPIVEKSANSININIQGQLDSSQDIGCISLADVKPTYAPPDLYKGVASCVDQAKYDLAYPLFALAGMYARFDGERVADRTAAQARQVLIMQTFAKFSESQKKAFSENVAQTTKDPMRMASLCTAIEGIGKPDYFPRYMILHGMAAFTKPDPLANALVPDFDAESTWQRIQTDYLMCQKSGTK